VSPARNRKAGNSSARRVVRRTKSAGPLLAQGVRRRRWLRFCAYGVGLFVFLAHVYTFDTPPVIRNMFALDIRDVLYHGGMLTAFALAYRFSLADSKPLPGRRLQPADASALAVCCTWGALCECAQLFIPAREFSFTELTLNTVAPAFAIALVSLTQGQRDP
jgi:peptidoglycan/LPS O-acetylase OafA/YrhL